MGGLLGKEGCLDRFMLEAMVAQRSAMVEFIQAMRG